MTKTQSPCRGCKNEFEDKRKHPECKPCELPIIYEKSLGCHSESVPAEVVKMSEKPEEKICKDPKCEHNGKPQPVDTNFQIHGLSGQRMGVCKDCMGRKISEGRQWKGKKPDRLVPAKKIKDKNPAEPDNHTIRIDFTGHEELLDLIRQVAEAEERTVERQLFYWIKKMDIQKLRGFLDGEPSVLS